MQPELSLEYPNEDATEHERLRVAAERMRRKLNDAIDEIGRKTVCFDLGITNQLLCKRMYAEDEKQHTALTLLYALAHEKSGLLAKFIARETGYAPFQRPEVLTPDQRLARIEEALRANPSMARVIYEDAFGPPRAPKLDSTPALRPLRVEPAR